MSKKSKEDKQKECEHCWVPMGQVYREGKLYKKWQCIFCFKVRHAEKL